MKYHAKLKFTCMGLGSLLLVACDTLNLPPLDERITMEVEGRHITAAEPAPLTDIPEIVRDLPVVTPPQAEPPLELYSVIVQDVSVRELLFAMARDANINIDVHSSVAGVVSINAIDQSLPQILERIANQVDIRWNFARPDYLVVQPDLPVLRSYHIDYVNVARSSISEVSVSSAVTGGIGDDAGGGGEANNSTTSLSQSSANDFWVMLQTNLSAIVGESTSEESTAPSSIIVSPESGLVSVRANHRQHEEIYEFI